MALLRKPTEDELNLIQRLLAASDVQIALDLVENLMVSDLEDGGMGSLQLFPPGCSSEDRGPVRFASDVIFEDSDGVKVIATLYTDYSGQLYELDLWKTDFSRLNRVRIENTRCS